MITATPSALEIPLKMRRSWSPRTSLATLRGCQTRASEAGTASCNQCAVLHRRDGEMKNMFWTFGVSNLIMAAFALAIGLRGLIRKRPRVFSARWLLGFMVMAFAPQKLWPLFAGFARR